jgi:sugar lactone lactonase YvrE
MAEQIVETLIPNYCQLGEGPHWSGEEQCLYYVDIFGKKVCRYDPQKKENKSIQVLYFKVLNH